MASKTVTWNVKGFNQTLSISTIATVMTVQMAPRLFSDLCFFGHMVQIFRRLVFYSAFQFQPSDPASSSLVKRKLKKILRTNFFPVLTLIRSDLGKIHILRKVNNTHVQLSINSRLSSWKGQSQFLIVLYHQSHNWFHLDTVGIWITNMFGI